MKIIRAGVSLGKRLKGWANAYFDKDYAGAQSITYIPFVSANQNYVPLPGGGYGPEVDANGDPVYTEQNDMMSVIAPVRAFLGAYSVDDALSKLGLSSGSQRKGYVQTGDTYPTKPAGAGYAFEMAVPFSADYGLGPMPAGMHWSVDDPEWVYLTNEMTESIRIWVKVYFYNGSTMLQDYAYLDIQGRYRPTVNDPWSSWGGVGGLSCNTGGVRVSFGVTFEEPNMRGNPTFEYRVRVKVGSTSETSMPTVGGCYMHFY